MKIEKNAPAQPCMPMQDSLGRFFSPISGFTKYEYVVLSLYTHHTYNSSDTLEEDMKYCMKMADVFFDKLNELEDEKNNISTIIQ